MNTEGNKALKYHKLIIGGEEKEYARGTKLLDIMKEYQVRYKDDIVLAKIDNKLRELTEAVNSDGVLEWVTTGDEAGMRTYRRSMVMLMLKAFYDVLKKIKSIDIQFSISSGYYCTLSANRAVDSDLLKEVTERMRELIKKRVPIIKSTMSTRDAIKEFEKIGMHEKARLYKYRRASESQVYRLEDFTDYYYGYMVPDTSFLKYFKLYPYEQGFVLQMTDRENTKVVPEFKPAYNHFKALQEAREWGEDLNASNIGAINEIITDGGFDELILISEALQEAKIAAIAKEIVAHPNKRCIMIAGPSSSGKTTFSKRLSIQLRAHGIKPHPISVDNYYVNRVDTPKDENGNYDFENITAIDLEQFNRDMSMLLEGKEIELPEFDFVDGKRIYNGNFLKLGEKDVLVIEGIHALNDKMSYALPTESKFKIYISALMMVNVDEHNRTSTTDGRLFRRMVRDARTRGKSAKGTLEMWDSVRKGEDKYIFPYQDTADVTFNSSLLYELHIMKQYVEPLLLGISHEDSQYTQANRILKFFDYIVGVPSNIVPINSLTREFIGGGCFKI